MKAKDKSCSLELCVSLVFICQSTTNLSKLFIPFEKRELSIHQNGPSIVTEHGALHTQTNHLKLNFVLIFLKKEIVIRGCLAYR